MSKRKLTNNVTGVATDLYNYIDTMNQYGVGSIEEQDCLAKMQEKYQGISLALPGNPVIEQFNAARRLKTTLPEVLKGRSLEELTQEEQTSMGWKVEGRRWYDLLMRLGNDGRIV